LPADITLQHSSGFKKAEDDANVEAEEKLKEIQAAGKKQGDKVVSDLIKATTDVKPEVPEKIAA
jgi:V-type H+-transporting ATPase subunit G